MSAIMRAQIVLTPAESKRLIGKAVAAMDAVRHSVARGMVVIHPCSSTYFIAQELTGQKPKAPRWVCGIIVPKGACSAAGAEGKSRTERAREATTGGPGAFPYTMVIKGGKLSTGERLDTLLERMGPDDVYIKAANALDVEGTVGVLFGNRVGAGTIGLAIAASRRRKFQMIYPVGLEKLVPVRIGEAAKEAGKNKYYYSMGMNCGLLPCHGTVVTEIEAINMLSGAEAIPIASGGLEGAEGAVVLVMKGEKEQVDRAIEYCEAVKGTKLPRVNIPECHNCTNPYCDFPVGDKHWDI